jgi:superfamily II DNA or RNA helicase
VRLIDAKLRAARARIAAAVAGVLPPEELGEIRLRADQRLAVARVTEWIDRDGGALLADDVGRGKTFVALAVARRWARPLVVAPASLRDTWEQAMRRAGVPCAFISHEALSRRRRPDVVPDGVIVDESHRFRSSTTRRYDMLATLAARVPVLLMSATPLQNRPRDLAAQLAIFLGTRALSFDVDTLARFVVRTPMLDRLPMPAVAPPQWLALDADDRAVLRAILSLPPPARAIDAGDGGVLRTITLVRAWASSRAALARMIERRRSAALAIERSAAAGVWPSRRELRVWHGGEGVTQLGFASLLAHATVRDAVRDKLLQAARAECEGLDRIDAAMRDSPDPDQARVRALRALRDSDLSARILAFSEKAGTVRAYWSALRSEHAVGMLTSGEARIASGRITRDELLDRFAPHARGVRVPHPREAVTLLLTTDLLSEGVNLQDASVVVHLDLPWNPARLAQRIGRVRRLGGASEVRSILVPPPASTELLLAVESKLRRKLADAERTIGRSLPVLPSLTSQPEGASPAQDGPPSADVLGATYSRIVAWQCTDRERLARLTRPILAGVVAAQRGWLAAFDDGRLLASLDGAPPDGGAFVAVAVRLADGPARPVGSGEAAATRESLARRLDGERVQRTCGLDSAADEVRRACERRVALEIARVARHERASILAMGQRLRGLLQRPRSVGTDRALLALLSASRGSALEWLASAVALVDAPLGARAAGDAGGGASLAALIVFGPE